LGFEPGFSTLPLVRFCNTVDLQKPIEVVKLDRQLADTVVEFVNLPSSEEVRVGNVVLPGGAEPLAIAANQLRPVALSRY
jgi:hypothetical protein